jgi:hypothetical protein
MSNTPMQTEEKRGPVAWMAGNSVAANLLMLICLVGGFLSLRSMKQEVFPDIALDMVTVSVAYPGASPEEVEDGIILAIEEAVRNLDGVYEITGTARESGGYVLIELLRGANVYRLAQEVKSEIDRIITFPEEAEEPEVRINQVRREVLSVVLYGDASTAVLHRTGKICGISCYSPPTSPRWTLKGCLLSRSASNHHRMNCGGMALPLRILRRVWRPPLRTSPLAA